MSGVTVPRDDEQGGLTVSVSHPQRGTLLEFSIERVTDVKERFILIDDEGEGRLSLTADELAALAVEPVGTGGDRQ